MINIRFNSYKFWLFLLLSCAVVIASISLFTNLNSSLRLDEAQSLWATTKTVPGLLEYIAQDVHVPLYFLTLHFWIKVFGTSNIALRSLSVVFFLLTLPVVYKLAALNTDKKTALLSTAFFCLSPFITWYSSEARMYTLLLLSTMLSHLFFLKLLKSKGKTDKFWFVCATILGLYSHYFFNLVVFVQVIYVLYVYSHKKKLVIFPDRNFMIKLAGLFTTAYLFFLPWIAYVVSLGSSNNTKPLLITPTSYNILQLFIHFLTGFQTQTIQAGLISLWPLTIVLLFFTFSKKKSSSIKYAGYYLLATFLPIILAFVISYTFQPILLSRYLIFVTPTLFILLAVLIRQFNTTILSLVLSAVFLTNIIFHYQQGTSQEIAERENYRVVVDFLNENVSTNDIVVVSAPFTIYPIEYYYAGQAKIETVPQWNRFIISNAPVFNEADFDTQINAYREQYDKLFIVLSYDQGYENTIRTYLDSRYALENQKTFSPGLELRQYKLRYN